MARRAYQGPMRIEPARPADREAVANLLAQQFRDHGIELGMERLSVAVEGLLSDSARGAVLVASDPEPVGVAVLAYTWTLEHGGRVAWLDELFVVPERQGQGIGRALLLRAIEVARGSSCRAVELEVDSEHARAENLYLREGFFALPRRRWVNRLG